MPNILAFSTSTSFLSVAVKKGKSSILEQTEPGSFAHAEKLLPSIDQLLRKAKLKLQNIDTFLIDRGPGSFTGLRIGFSTLKGILALKKKDCYGCLSLDMIAQNCGLQKEGKLAVVMDAYRQKIYARFYRAGKKSAVFETKIKILSFDELISVDHSPQTFWAGNALARYHSLFIKHVPKELILPESLWYPRSSAMISQFEKSHPSKDKNSIFKKLNTPADFLPLYFRLSEAEERRVEYANSN
jgi:tRNA threonylcarbamoyladenosine biosynthesis protein TsaB